MYLEAVITCVNYGDYLAATLPHNRHQFDRAVVVTTPEDRETQRICEYWHVECIQTPAFHAGSFAKAAGINVGLDHLGRRDWIWHLDADIFLPPLTRDLLERAKLDPLNLYGADRFMVPDYLSWCRFLRLPSLQHENDIFVHPNTFNLGVRVSTSSYGGYVPIGFSQLWNAKSGVKTYPAQHTDAGRSDMLFARQWPRERRALIPEFFVYHLQSGPEKMGANWAGRVTPDFGPGPAITRDWPEDAGAYT